ASGRAPGTAPGGAVDPDAIGAGGEPVPERSTSTSDLAGSSDPAGSSEAQSTAFDRASHGEGDDGSSSVWRRGWRPVLLGFAALLLVWLLALFGPLRSDPPAETGTPSPLPAELDDAFQRLERELAP
ncbi:MAG: hypothetical protein JJT89_09710, partial [Nitriliruptoraceae bacterium]|nr:hypothetical protein [Nitriliruptoraceae bacterium]